MKTKPEMTELRSFLSGYFHEDWTLDASSTDEVVAQFLKAGPSSAKIDRIVSQIQACLNSQLSDEAIERNLLQELGCYYLPSADGLGARAWLFQVAELLKK